MVDREHLRKVWKLLDDRTRELGLSRYDYGDVNSNCMMYALSQRRYTRPLYKFLKVPEYLFPVFWRKLLRIPKTIVPSVYYHLGLAYLDAERIALGVTEADTDRICNSAIRESIADAEHMCWVHPYRHHAGSWKGDLEASALPLSCAHHTGRVGTMLLTVGIVRNNREFIEAGVSAAHALLSYHNWRIHETGTCAVSYYPNTDDEVINTGADVAVLLALVPDCHKTDEMRSRVAGLVKMVCTEQNADGSWFYCTEKHYARHAGVMYIDNHHTAMNIAALAHIASLKVLDEYFEAQVIKTIEKGMAYYLNNFTAENGDSYYFPNSRRDAGVVGHAEGIFALLRMLVLGGNIDPGLRRRAEKATRLLLDKAITKYVDLKTGDVACYRNFGKRYQIASARWGSAPIMQAISAYLNYQDDERGCDAH